MRARSVIERILNELEAGNPDRVERLVIGAARVSHGNRADSQIREGSDPLLEDGSDGRVLLQVDAANFSRPVVDVEVSGNLLLLGFQLDRSRRLSQEIRQLELIGGGRQRHEAKMLLHVAV